jgi:AcrR family transcriptional regulator
MLLSIYNNAMKTTPAWAVSVKDAKRDFLLQAAREEFMDKGLEGATMRGISLRAGCTTGAIYPLFDSKEDIYAALLGQSLSRLDAHVAAAVAPGATPAAQVAAACAAFLAYYGQHPFEVNLGLYAFRGIKRSGVGKDSDLALNQALWTVLERIALPLAQARGLPAQEVRPWVALVFSQMIGALVLQLAGRLDALKTNPKDLLRLMLAQLLPVEPAAPAPKPTATRKK